MTDTPAGPATAAGLRAAAQKAIDSGDTFRGREELRAALAADLAPVPAPSASADAAWTEVRRDLDHCFSDADERIARYRPAIEAAIRAERPALDVEPGT